MSLQNSKFPSKLESAEMADETELFYTSVSKQPVIAGALVSVNDLHAGLSSFVFRVKQITQNPVVVIPCGFAPRFRHQMKHGGFDTGVSETIVLFVVMRISRLNGKRQVMPIRASE